MDIKIFRRRFRLSVNTILILINVLVFIILSIVFSVNPNSSIMNYIALRPADILQGKHLWTFLTSMFSHTYFWHLAFNMISLFFVGILLERILGPKRYLWFYLISGLFAGLVFVLLSGFFGTTFLGAKIFGNPTIMGIGASGAIFGLLGILAVLTPKNKVSLIAGPLIAIILDSFLISAFPNSAITNVFGFIFTIYIFFSLFTILSFNPKIIRFSLPVNMPFWLLPIVAIIPLVIAGLFVQLPIANSAHFGGLIAGMAYGFYLKYKFPNKTKIISKIFSR